MAYASPLFAIAFTAANLIFVLAYTLDCGLQNARPCHFTDALFVRIQTMALMAPIGSSTMTRPAEVPMNWYFAISLAFCLIFLGANAQAQTFAPT